MKPVLLNRKAAATWLKKPFWPLLKQRLVFNSSWRRRKRRKSRKKRRKMKEKVMRRKRRKRWRRRGRRRRRRKERKRRRKKRRKERMKRKRREQSHRSQPEPSQWWGSLWWSVCISEIKTKRSAAPPEKTPPYWIKSTNTRAEPEQNPSQLWNPSSIHITAVLLSVCPLNQTPPMKQSTLPVSAGQRAAWGSRDLEWGQRDLVTLGARAQAVPLFHGRALGTQEATPVCGLGWPCGELTNHHAPHKVVTALYVVAVN